MLKNECCIKTMFEMPENHIDLIITSPPYDFIRNYGGAAHQLFNFQAVAWQIKRVLKPGGVCVWVVGDQVKDGNESGTAFRQALFFKDQIKFRLFDTIIYEKSRRPVGAKNGYWQNFEYMFVFSKGKIKTINLLRDAKNLTTSKKMTYTYRCNKTDKMIKKETAGNGPIGRRNNIWKYYTGHQKSTMDKMAFEHPAIMPEKMARDHILAWSNEGDLIYDPFMGSGTTAKMAIMENRRWVGSEINPKYCDLVKHRLESILNWVDDDGNIHY